MLCQSELEHRSQVGYTIHVQSVACLKDERWGRQIGDRRGRNRVEQRLPGPSSSLPSGVGLTSLFLDGASETLSISITDRKDAYRQFSVSENRAKSNTVGPRLSLNLLRDTRAFAALSLARSLPRGHRVHVGDNLGTFERQTFAECDKSEVMISFASVFQGDHLGVEIATSSHEGLFLNAGLLKETTRVVADRATMPAEDGRRRGRGEEKTPLTDQQIQRELPG